MGETSFKELDQAARRAGRRYEPVRVIKDSRFEQLVSARDSWRHDFVLLRRVMLPQPQDPFAFQERAQRLLFAQHPNLAVVRDYFIDPEQRGVLVMDPLQGMTLEEYAGQMVSMLSPKTIVVELVNISIAVAKGLAALHHQGLVHGSVSPHTVVLSGRDGLPVLTGYNLGIAPPPALTTTSIVRPPWIAPEVKPSYRLPQDPRADVYSLGATLYSMLVGVAPRMAKDEDTAFTPASKFNIFVDPRLDAIIAQMAMKDPAKRPVATDALRYLETWKQTPPK
jgi:serine/threonine-protein kinase